MTKEQKIIKNMIFKELDLIYSSSKKLAKTWNVNTIPVNHIRELVKILNDGKKEINNDQANVFIDVYKKTLNKLVITCQKLAKNMNSKSIPLAVLKQCLNSIKSGFQDGITQAA